MAEKPSPFELWQQADGDRVRYQELMREHGHLIPGKPEPLPCGWPTDLGPASSPQEAARAQISNEERIAKICRDHDECAESGCSLGEMVVALDEAWSEVHRLRAALAEVRRQAAEELHAYADREYSGAADMATQERVMRKAASIVRGES